MIKRAYAIGLLTFATLGFASLPVQAQSSEDSVTPPTVVNTSKQTANQGTVIYGDRNSRGDDRKRNGRDYNNSGHNSHNYKDRKHND